MHFIRNIFKINYKYNIEYETWMNKLVENQEKITVAN